MEWMITHDLLYKFIKFGSVGCSGLFVDFGVTWGCKEKLRISRYVANSIGFIVAASSNYYLNRVWTFGSLDQQVLLQYTAFFFISLVGLALNNLIIYLLHSRWPINFYVAKLAAVGLVLVWNFFANYFYTFN
ncbi:MAG: GtrA family protein [Bacteroidota bacterium]